MLKPLYDWALGLASSRLALPALAGVAMLEATFPFVPPDVMLGPMVLARRERAWLYAAVCTLASVTGGCIGYALGYFASDFALRFLTAVHHPDAFDAFKAVMARWGLAVILVKGLTPVPYMLVTIASGLAHFSLPVFIGASLITRGGRFFLEAALLRHPGAKAFVDKNLTVLVIAALAGLVCVYVGFGILEHRHR
jgi:membrane protein YqaA with SNARE-associated domain